MEQSPLVRIVVTGDAFYERFLWADPDSGAHGPLPYTWPDELRSPRTTATVAELSGAPLHSRIFRHYLDSWKRASEYADEIAIDLIPTCQHKRILTAENSAGSLPVYLHELGAFPVPDVGDRPSDSYVWRIARSFGRIVVPPSDNPPAPVDIEPLLNLLRSPPPDVPHVIVINDRDLGFRDHFRLPPATAGTFAIDNPHPNCMILWHARLPLFRTNPLAEVLSTQPLNQITIPIVNHHCLRDEGLPLRFDMSYESTLRSLLAALEHPLLKRLLAFPHILVRFDYGILHLSTQSGRLVGLDIHGLNAGPYHFNLQRHGVITGRTPLLVASILGEVCAFIKNKEDPKDKTIGAFLYESNMVWHPTIQNNTSLDRAIDAALLIGSLHFRRGFGRYSVYDKLTLQDVQEHNGDQQGGTDAVYKSLSEEFWGRREKPNPLPQKRGTRSLLDEPAGGIWFRHPAPSLDRLARLSVPKHLLSRSPSGPNNRDAFSRVDLLVTDLVKEGVPLRVDKDDPDEAQLANFDLILRKIVQFGLERVLTRDDSGDGPDTTVLEPSIWCPFVSFGRHLSIDSREIDGFLALRFLVAKYLAQTDWNRPLAIAVFGSPGSGKGYLVNEVLKSVPFYSFDDAIDCNMSQLSAPSGLSRQFHRIQDRALQGEDEIPIAFFDEFDTPCQGKDVGWLRYFLMPLQDGLYVDGDDSFHVGRSIFVFAGGVAHTYGQFNTQFRDRLSEKVPDFISRLRGYIDVQDICLTEESSSESKHERGTSVFYARAAQVRRAIILRSMLLAKMPQIVDQSSKEARIHGAIVDAFVNVAKFTHGVRSIEAIVEMSRVPTGVTASFQPSALPPESQLEMHVSVESFMGYVHGSIG